MVPLRLILLAYLAASGALMAGAGGLSDGPNATVLRYGKPFSGIGMNYFNCFLRRLETPGDTSYDAGFATLSAKGIPFVRFSAAGFGRAG
jgi:hypothetical protein